MPNNKQIAKMIKEYKNVFNIYEEFTKAVKFILKTLLKCNSFNYQIVQGRTKSIEALQKKLKTDLKVTSITKLQDIYDLSGCRVIFYLESDIKNFLIYLKKEFEIKKGDLKYSKDGYNAYHIIIKLKKERIKLLEYNKFINLYCEIQLTTVLFHAWSEMSHITIYKSERELSNFDKHKFKPIKKHFNQIMKNYIKEASYEFEIFYKNFQKLKQGKEVFSINALNEIFNSYSIKEIYEKLKILKINIESLGDKSPDELKSIDIIRKILEKSKKLKPEQISGIFGKEEINYSTIFLICLEILEILAKFYTDTENVFHILIDLYKVSEIKPKEIILAKIKNIIKYDFFILQSPRRFYFQKLILNNFKQDYDELIKLEEIIFIVAKEILKLSCEGHSMKDYKTYVIHYAALKPTSELKNMRKQTIDLLIKIFKYSNNHLNKIKIIEILGESLQLPININYEEKIIDIIINDSNYIIKFFIDIISGAEFEIINEIQKVINWILRFFKKEEFPEIDKLEKLIISNNEYKIYKDLIGVPERFFNLDLNQVGQETNSKIRKYISTIQPGNFVIWENRLLSYLEKYTLEKQNEYYYFHNFCFEFGKQKPDLAKKIILKNEKEFKPFLIDILMGIWHGGKNEIVKNIIKKWLKKEKNINLCASFFLSVGDIEEKLLRTIFLKAKRKKDTKALNYIVILIFRNYKITNKKILLETINELTRNKNHNWIYSHRALENSVIQLFSETEIDIILKNLLLVPNIDNHLEKILGLIAICYSKKIIQYFYNRILIGLKIKDINKYTDIPYKLCSFYKRLQNNEDIIINEIIKLFDKGDFFRFKAANLIQVFFPEFNKILENRLIELINSGKKKNRRIVIYILQAYNGESFLHNVCKNIIIKYPKDKELYKDIFYILTRTGTLTGEYAFVNEYKNKLKMIEHNWIEQNKSIESFANEYKKYLQKRIDYEKKKADEEIELMKRNLI